MLSLKASYKVCVVWNSDCGATPNHTSWFGHFQTLFGLTVALRLGKHGRQLSTCLRHFPNHVHSYMLRCENGRKPYEFDIIDNCDTGFVITERIGERQRDGWMEWE